MAMKSFPMLDGLLVQFPGTHDRVVVRICDGGLCVTDDKCKHRGGPLHLGHCNEAGHLICPWHGRRAKATIKSNLLAAIFRKDHGQVTLVTTTVDGREWPVKYLPAKSTQPGPVV
jgi:nitrite reductase/ring-hydroxylating ferredoxin subunit